MVIINYIFFKFIIYFHTIIVFYVHFNKERERKKELMVCFVMRIYLLNSCAEYKFESFCCSVSDSKKTNTSVRSSVSGKLYQNYNKILKENVYLVFIFFNCDMIKNLPVKLSNLSLSSHVYFNPSNQVFIISLHLLSSIVDLDHFPIFCQLIL